MHAPHLSARRRAAALSALVLAAVALSACSSSDGPEPAGETSAPTATPTASPSAYLDVPEGTELTGQGAALGIGDPAVVAWQPKQSLVGVLDITVDRVELTTFKKSFQGWKLDEQAKASTPYFVHATIENVGDTDLSGQQVPLYIVDGTNTLIEASSFVSTFEPCPSKPLPEGFEPGESADVCLVYLAPDAGTLEAVSFRPTEDFNPITWTGDISKVKGPGAGDKGGDKDGDGKGGKGNGGAGTDGS
ncbi:MAG: hypothetical protein F2667_06505 [Actinobacteria bacterium]|uniref:Unannotated protein n=1 Tax=freshwater metagenome TaxID=449393 RepID=A0A6J6Q7F3_9ZZZZ|nr:hypothetical protein [Actinomycetota bacterium]